MRKQEFLDRLGQLLACLPADQVAESQAFYAEAIDDRMEEGMTEEEAVAAMGSPGEAAEAILDDLPAVPRAVAKTKRKSKVLLWVLVIVGSPIWLSLLVAFGITALAVYACIWIFAACIWVIAAALVVAAPVCWLFALDGATLGLFPFALAYAGSGLLALGLGLLTGYGALAATRQLARLSAAWGRKIASPFRKDSGEVDGTASGGGTAHGGAAGGAASGGGATRISAVGEATEGDIAASGTAGNGAACGSLSGRTTSMCPTAL